jgi:hypothetical protein
MERFEQYEIWSPQENSARWQLIAAFHDFDVASAVASRRGRRVRLIHAVYLDGKLAEQQVIAELGSPRENP